MWAESYPNGEGRNKDRRRTRNYITLSREKERRKKIRVSANESAFPKELGSLLSY